MAIIAPIIYPVVIFVPMGLDVANTIVAYIAIDFITIQKCKRIYKGFVRIILWGIKII